MKAFLKSFWEAWKRFGRFMGTIVTRVIMTFFYFTIFAPFGIGVRLFSDPLQIKSDRAKAWNDRQTGDKTLDDIKLQF